MIPTCSCGFDIEDKEGFKDHWPKCPGNPKNQLAKAVAEVEDLGHELALLWFRAYPKLHAPDREFKFTTTKDWRFDLAWPPLMIAVEGEGGIFQHKPSHSSASGIARDIAKYNQATMEGWTVLRIHRGMIDDGSYLKIFDWVATQFAEQVNQ